MTFCTGDGMKSFLAFTGFATACITPCLSKYNLAPALHTKLKAFALQVLVAVVFSGDVHTLFPRHSLLFPIA